MSQDLVCSVCGEPWDYHHVHHDIPLWQSKLFQKGYGCESCEGTRPKDFDYERVGRELLNDIDDHDKIHRLEIVGEPEVDFSQYWVKPPALVLATCEGCGRKAEIDQDDIYPYRKDGKQIGRIVIWTAGPGIGTRNDVPLDELGMDQSDAKWKLSDIEFDWNFEVRDTLGGKILCHECWTTCASCDAYLYAGEAQEKFCKDTYDPGNSFYCQDDNRTRCITCEETRPQCTKCQAHVDDQDDLDEEGHCESCKAPPVIHLGESAGFARCNEVVDEENLTDDLDAVTCHACKRTWEKSREGLPHLLMPGMKHTLCGIAREDLKPDEYVESVTDAEIRCWECHEEIVSTGDKDDKEDDDAEAPDGPAPGPGGPQASR